MKNTKGFGVVEVIIVLVMLGLVGVGGWYVWEANRRPGDNSTNQQPQNNLPQDNGHTTFNQDPAPFTFKYPKAWTIKLDEKLGATLPDNYTIVLSSASVALTEQPIGGFSVTQGAQITITASKTIATDVDSTFTDFRSHIKDRKTTTVGNLKASEYEFGYESQVQHYVDFIKDGYLYSVSYASAKDERMSTDYTEYTKLLSSWKFK